MISRRFNDLETNKLSKTLNQFKNDKSSYIDLSNFNPISVDCYFESISKINLFDIDKRELFSYLPSPSGLVSARLNIIQGCYSHLAYKLNTDEIILTSSTSESYSWLFKLLCDPDDIILIISPHYPLLKWLMIMENIHYISIPLIKYDRWHLDLSAIEKCCTVKVRAIIIINPNNPTGSFLLKSEWQQLTVICAKYGIAIIVDEVFRDYILEPSEDLLVDVVSIANDCYCPVFVLSGISKILCLPQIKLGWIIAANRLAKRLMPMLEFIADSYLSVSSYAQISSAYLLRYKSCIQSDVIKRIRNNIAILDLLVSGNKIISRSLVEGGWTVMIKNRMVTSCSVYAIDILRRARVLVCPGSFFSIRDDSCFVISLIIRSNIFYDGVQRILQLY